jgi:hypothetical protein
VRVQFCAGLSYTAAIYMAQSAASRVGKWAGLLHAELDAGLTIATINASSLEKLIIEVRVLADVEPACFTAFQRLCDFGV